jgi:hypothetical protein
MTMLWVNLHAGFMLGLAMVVIYIAGDLVDFFKVQYFKTVQSHVPTLKNIGSLGGFLGVSILAAVVNPNGIRLFTYPLETLTSQSMQQFIQEWFSPDFHQTIWQPLAWFILALIASGLLGHKPVSSTKILLTLSFGYAALHSMRHVPLFAIAAIPVLAEEIVSFMGQKIEIRETHRQFGWVNLVLLALVLLAAGLRFVSVIQEQPKAERDKFPAAAVDWIVQYHPEGNMFNTYGWGGYLIWRLYPEYRVFIDGRADVYGDQFIYDFLSIYRADPGWEERLSDVNLALLEAGAPLANRMADSPDWQLVFSDNKSVLFTRR